jgi:hypothetical protein
MAVDEVVYEALTKICPYCGEEINHLKAFDKCEVRRKFEVYNKPNGKPFPSYYDMDVVDGSTTEEEWETPCCQHSVAKTEEEAIAFFTEG